MHFFLPQVLYTLRCTSKLYADTIFLKEVVNILKEKNKGGKKHR
jgi:hypothetical protein